MFVIQENNEPMKLKIMQRSIIYTAKHSCNSKSLKLLLLFINVFIHHWAHNE